MNCTVWTQYVRVATDSVRSQIREASSHFRREGAIVNMPGAAVHEVQHEGLDGWIIDRLLIAHVVAHGTRDQHAGYSGRGWCRLG